MSAEHEAAKARCRMEIAAAKDELRAGNIEVDGLVRAIVDWSYTLRELEAEEARNGEE